MSQTAKLFTKVCSGKADKNVKFLELRRLLIALGFSLNRIEGDHFIFIKDGIPEIINIQPDKRDSSKAKSVQVKQIRYLIEKYHMEVKQ